MPRTTLVALLLFAVPALVRAQAPSYDQAIRASAALRLAAPAPLVPEHRAIAADLMVRARRRDRATGTTLMIIGAGGIVAGAIVGGTGGALLVVGGLGVGAYGVYLYQP